MYTYTNATMVDCWLIFQSCCLLITGFASGMCMSVNVDFPTGNKQLFLPKLGEDQLFPISLLFVTHVYTKHMFCITYSPLCIVFATDPNAKWAVPKVAKTNIIYSGSAVTTQFEEYTWTCWCVHVSVRGCLPPSCKTSRNVLTHNSWYPQEHTAKLMYFLE